MAMKLELDELSTEDAWTELIEDIKPVEADMDFSLMAEHAEIATSKHTYLDEECRDLAEMHENQLRIWAGASIKKIQSAAGVEKDLQDQIQTLNSKNAALKSKNGDLKRQLKAYRTRETYFLELISSRWAGLMCFRKVIRPLPPIDLPDVALDDDVK